MVQYKKMKFAVLASCVLLATLPAIAAMVEVPSLPPSPYADTAAKKPAPKTAPKPVAKLVAKPTEK